MLKHYILTVLLLSFLTSNAQSSEQNPFSVDKRKNQLFFSVGSEYRITPIQGNPSSLSSNGSNEFRVGADQIGSQNTGTAFYYSLDYFLAKNLSIGFSNSIRYDTHITDQTNLAVSNNVGPISKTFIFDYHFYADYHINAFKNSELLLRIGRSYLNDDTDITARNGEGVSNFSFTYWSWNFGLGYEKERTLLFLGAYSASSTNYPAATSLLIPYLSFKYKLGNLWKN